MCRAWRAVGALKGSVLLRGSCRTGLSERLKMILLRLRASLS